MSGRNLFTLGVTWPLVYPVCAFDRVFLVKLQKATGLRTLRVNLDHRNLRANDAVQEAIDAGFTDVQPIYDLDYEALAQSPDFAKEQWWPRYLDFTGHMTERWKFRRIAVLNEPDTAIGKTKTKPGRARIDHHTYARVCNAVGFLSHDVNPNTQVIVAAEMLQPNERGPKPKKYWRQVRSGLIPELYDDCGIHHYRQPGPPQRSRFGRSICRRTKGTRRQEHEFVMAEARGKSVVVDEIGWNLDRLNGDEALQAACLVDEIRINIALGIKYVNLYAHVGPFGLMREDGTPRLAAEAINDLDL
jgi:hypothetical protein